MDAFPHTFRSPLPFLTASQMEKFPLSNPSEKMRFDNVAVGVLVAVFVAVGVIVWVGV